MNDKVRFPTPFIENALKREARSELKLARRVDAAGDLAKAGIAAGQRGYIRRGKLRLVGDVEGRDLEAKASLFAEAEAL